jgi:hypothetical protein
MLRSKKYTLRSLKSYRKPLEYIFDLFFFFVAGSHESPKTWNSNKLCNKNLIFSVKKLLVVFIYETGSISYDYSANLF